MRRLPVYLLIDTSESMIGQAIEAVRTGLGTMLSALRKNPYALEMGALGVITFGGTARKVTPLTEVYAFQQPDLEVKPGTMLGGAISLLDQAISTEIVRTTPDRKGDYKPLVFVLTDGQPTDEWRSAFHHFKQNHKSVVLYAIGCGNDVDFTILKELTENTYSMEQMDADAFAKLFVCISSSITSASGAIGDQGKQGGAINLEKDAGGTIRKIEKAETIGSRKQRQVFIPGVCQKTRKPYLLRYRWNDEDGCYQCMAGHKLEKAFSREETGAIETVSSSELQGLVPCPHCGNEGHGRCDCGTVTCYALGKGFNSMFGTKVCCPGCGKIGHMASGGVFNVGQSRG
ncbi:MAG: von Willebrand factor type A domain protein [Lentisphaerae bacterium ADurb.Bin242]|nr:MAG: von Willebrand factor type A domain protein [Lentisphaerae bacterium ADurb.Bin242]